MESSTSGDDRRYDCFPLLDIAGLVIPLNNPEESLEVGLENNYVGSSLDPLIFTEDFIHPEKQQIDAELE